MPYKEKVSFKLYYTINEVSAMFDVNPSLLRFWEREFEALRPQKNKRGNRIYTEADLQLLKQIHELVKNKGYTLQGAKKKLSTNGPQVQNNAELVARLTEVRSLLVELRDAI